MCLWQQNLFSQENPQQNRKSANFGAFFSTPGHRRRYNQAKLKKKEGRLQRQLLFPYPPPRTTLFH
jgi:hypothetical protein